MFQATVSCDCPAPESAQTCAAEQHCAKNRRTLDSNSSADMAWRQLGAQSAQLSAAQAALQAACATACPPRLQFTMWAPHTDPNAPNTGCEART